MMIESSLCELLKARSSEVPSAQSELIRHYIQENTNMVNGFVALPSRRQREFSVARYSAFPDFKEFSNRITDIFKPPLEPSGPDIYLMSEEAKQGSVLIPKIPFDVFTLDVAAYIYNHGDLRNYWATDGQEMTVTFHHDGFFWKKSPADFSLK